MLVIDAGNFIICFFKTYKIYTGLSGVTRLWTKFLLKNDENYSVLGENSVYMFYLHRHHMLLRGVCNPYQNVKKLIVNSIVVPLYPCINQQSVVDLTWGFVLDYIKKYFDKNVWIVLC